MSAQFERLYRTKGHELNDDFFNTRFRDVDLRLVDLETQIGQFDEAVDALIQRGLEQINTQLQASIATLQSDVASAVEQVEAAQDLLEQLEQAVQDIISGGTFPATSITVDIAGLEAANVEDALEEILGSLDGLEDAVDTKADAAATSAALASKADAAATTAALADKADASAVTSMTAALAAKLDASAYTAADVLTKILTVDGTGSGLDADKWKGAAFTVSTSTPSGGADGDFWFEREA